MKNSYQNAVVTPWARNLYQAMRFLLPFGIAGVVMWQGVARLFYMSQDEDNTYYDGRHAVQGQARQIFNTFLETCPSLNTDIDYKSTCVSAGIFGGEQCCSEDFLVNDCDYDSRLCTSVVNLLMGCSLTLWANFTSACDNLEEPPSSEIGYTFAGVFSALALVVLAVLAWRKSPAPEVAVPAIAYMLTLGCLRSGAPADEKKATIEVVEMAPVVSKPEDGRVEEEDAHLVVFHV